MGDAIRALDKYPAPEVERAIDGDSLTAEPELELDLPVKFAIGLGGGYRYIPSRVVDRGQQRSVITALL